MNALSLYLLLAVAIACEVAGTSFLKASGAFTRLLPSALTILFYAAAFYLLSIIVRTMPVGVVYAIWSGMGIVLIGLVGWLAFGQALNLPTMLGMALIIAGVGLVNLYSAAH
ncbi:MAG: DMT family transporter [Acidiphilium sp.]